MISPRVLLCSSLVSFALLLTTPADGAMTFIQYILMSAVENGVKNAGARYKEGKYPECAQEIAHARMAMERLAQSNDPEILRLLGPQHALMKRAIELLSEQGIVVAALPTVTELANPPVADAIATSDPNAVNSAAAGTADGTAMEVSFTKHVAPVVMTHCARCHVEDSRGEFSIPTYTAMVRGDNPSVVAGSPEESMLYDMIASGEMPPRGDGPSEQEAKLLYNWIAQGAVFDGPTEDTPLPTLAPTVAGTGEAGRGGARGGPGAGRGGRGGGRGRRGGGGQ